MQHKKTYALRTAACSACGIVQKLSVRIDENRDGELPICTSCFDATIGSSVTTGAAIGKPFEDYYSPHFETVVTSRGHKARLCREHKMIDLEGMSRDEIRSCIRPRREVLKERMAKAMPSDDKLREIIHKAEVQQGPLFKEEGD